MTAFYNEIDPYSAQWLRNLIAAGHIAPGVVDERSIEDIEPAELAQFTQCHFFAGIGVWSYALRLAGWPDDRPVWTGSCPCQPFSAAGKNLGFADERHLWPAFDYLIEQCKPPVVFGEQVASPVGLQWLDLVQVDLEAKGYAVAAVDLCAAGVGAPHIRQRLYWLADSKCRSSERHRFAVGTAPQRGNGEIRTWPQRVWDDVGDGLDAICVADTDHTGLEGRREPGCERAIERIAGPSSLADGMVERATSRPNAFDNHWRNADWILCRDGRWRPVESGTFPLAHGVAERVGRLRSYGNAIVPQVAQAFIEAYLKC